MLTISLVIIEVLMVVVAVYLIANNSLVDYSFAGNSFAKSNLNMKSNFNLKSNLKHSYNHSSYKIANHLSKIFSLNMFNLTRTLPTKFLSLNKFRSIIISFYKIYQNKFNRKNKVARVFIFTEKYSLSFQNVAAR
jgi:hypothetical protein